MEDREIYILPRTAESTFGELRTLMQGEEDFPATFDEWTRLWAGRHLEEEREGRKVLLIEVVPAAFAKFCKTRSLPGSWNTLGQFIAAKAQR